jgi:tetratricopeptide repeat protein
MRPDHHPEELVDRARQGALDSDAQSILNRHLAVCEACAGLLAQAPWVERELAPQPRDEILDQRAVEAAMRRMQRKERPSPIGRSHAWPQWLRAAAAGVLLVSGVTATAAIVRRAISPHAPGVSPPPRSVDLPAGRSAPTPVPPPVEAPGPAEQPTPSGVAPPPPAARPAVTAGALFERAGKLRREGRADAAIAIYRRLQDIFPDAREAQLSFAIAGQLLLERGRPKEALAQFDRHPKIGGDVGEETLAGRADALEQLNRPTDAIAAWKSLLERYPGSIYAARARARLAQLGARR